MLSRDNAHTDNLMWGFWRNLLHLRSGGEVCPPAVFLNKANDGGVARCATPSLRQPLAILEYLQRHIRLGFWNAVWSGEGL